MTTKKNGEIVYSINTNDIQNVANKALGRPLTKKEVLLIKESIDERIDWFGAIESAIQEHIRE